MRVVLTGVAGFIGSHTACKLLERGHEVIGIDSFDDFLYPAEIKQRNLLEVQEYSENMPFQFHQMDITDEQAIHGLMKQDVDVVVHLAALAGVRPSLEDPPRYIKTNLLGTTNILEAMKSAGVKRLACASSSSVYGVKSNIGGEIQAFCEDDPCITPASPYAATKRSAELICSSYRDLFGIGVSNLRFFTVYGPRQRPDMAIHKFFRAIASGQPIRMFGDGTSRRDYTYIDDIVSGTVTAAEQVVPGDFATYNLGGTHTISLLDLIRTIESTIGKKAIIDRQPLQPGDVPVTYANIARASAKLGYAPTTSVEEGLQKFWHWLEPRIEQ